MKKRMFLCLMLALVLVLAGCRKNPQETQPGEETTQSVETTEIQTGPVVDSMFDDDDWDQDTQESEPTEEETADKDDDKDSTKPTEGKDDNKKPTESTRPGGDAPDTDGPVDPPAPDDPDPTNPGGNKEPDPTEEPDNKDPVEVPDPDDIDYREFMDMTPAEQQAFMESFESIEAFFEWYEAAKAKYEEENPPIDVGDGNVTLPGNP